MNARGQLIDPLMWLFVRVDDLLRRVRRWNYRTLYLRSRHWCDFADECRELAGYRCEHCNATGVTLDVHHTTYSHIGRETWRDVVVLCRDCHEAEHAPAMARAAK